jgi:hypothetical protein
MLRGFLFPSKIVSGREVFCEKGKFKLYRNSLKNFELSIFFFFLRISYKQIKHKMKKVKILLTTMAVMSIGFLSIAQGLPPTDGCHLAALPAPGEASVYECADGSLQVRSTLLPNGACAGAEYDCISR